MHAFSYHPLPARVRFGVGSLGKLAEELSHLDAQRALVLCTREQRSLAERVVGLLGERAAGVFDRATMHVPIEVAHAARTEAERVRADCAVAVGGGSTIGLGKAIALTSTLPIIALPTTYAGSEVTSIYGLTEGGLKRTGRDLRVLPRSVLYDPELTCTLPVDLSVTSALNAVAHAAEGLYAHDGNPITSLMAEEGIRALTQALPRIVSNPSDVAARSDALYGAWLCGTVLGAVSMGLHHKLCHTLGGSYDLPHAPTHAVVLPYALAYNARHAADALAAVGRSLGTTAQAVPTALRALAANLGAPTSLQALGLPEDALDRVADLAVATPYPNPRPLERAALREMLQRAYDGQEPAA